MTVAIIGSRGFKMTRVSMKRLKKEITKLVVKDGARDFLFTGDCAFDFACWAIVFRLKTRNYNVRRIFVRTNWNDSDEKLKERMVMYEDAILPDAVRDAGMLAPCVRNEAMVEMCDVLVTYFKTDNLKRPRIKGYEEVAAEQAQQKKKRVINLFENR